MSAKRKKGKAGGHATGARCIEGGPSGRKGNTTGGENFVPVEMIALDDYGILTPREQIDAIKFLPDEDAPRFYVVRLKSREVIVELSPELAARAAELRHKVDAEQYGFTRSLMLAMQHTRRPKEGTALEDDLVWLAGGEGQLKPERILQAASLACRIRETLTERVIEMQRLPIGSDARKRAAKRLKALFASAIDSLNNPDSKMLDERSIVVEVDTAHGRIQKDVALVAIEVAREYIANHRNHLEEPQFEEPSKGELSAKIISKHPKAFSQPEARHSYWNKVWKKAGLSGLRQSEQ